MESTDEIFARMLRESGLKNKKDVNVSRPGPNGFKLRKGTGNELDIVIKESLSRLIEETDKAYLTSDLYGVAEKHFGYEVNEVRPHFLSEGKNYKKVSVGEAVKKVYEENFYKTEYPGSIPGSRSIILYKTNGQLKSFLSKNCKIKDVRVLTVGK